MSYIGEDIEVALSAIEVPLRISDTSIGELTNADHSLGISLIGGSMRQSSTEHIMSVYDMGINQRITLKGGNIIRNQTDGFVITGFTMSSEGISELGAPGNQLSFSFTSKPQSLLDADSQQKVAGILNSIDGYLQKSGSDLTNDQFNEVVDNAMSVLGGMIKSGNEALRNPLRRDQDTALNHDLVNYDQIYLGIPLDPGSITYIDEYSQDEWAISAAQVKQKTLCEQMVSTASNLMSTITNTLVQRESGGGLSPVSVQKEVCVTYVLIMLNMAS
ncbi:unnamed protein product [Toxocara canis]|uniref:Uncharacterized protein n=1 Tax=Toxocara canis TaxID=6265 RepID=A0A3P7GW42_TOXCA|nr:unnamed protein product [Toxocara canis]